MTDGIPYDIPADPPPDYAPASLARLALASEARDLADAARDLVPTGSDRYVYSGEFAAPAARLVERARRVLQLAVVVERMRDTSWSIVGDALGEVSRQAAHERYGKAETEFRDRIVRAWLEPESAYEILGAAAGDPARTIAALQTWWEHHREDNGEPDEERVDAGLEPLSRIEHAALVATAAALVGAADADPLTPQARLHTLEVAYLRRKVQLQEWMIAEGEQVEQARLALAETRARLTELGGHG
jgi:hypothetical protein